MHTMLLAPKDVLPGIETTALGVFFMSAKATPLLLIDLADKG